MAAPPPLARLRIPPATQANTLVKLSEVILQQMAYSIQQGIIGCKLLGMVEPRQGLIMFPSFASFVQF